MHSKNFDFQFPAFFGILAVIIFGARGDGRDFMPEWEHNFHSWSFGLAAVGAILQCVDAVLFLIEARIMDRRQRAYEKQDNGDTKGRNTDLRLLGALYV